VEQYFGSPGRATHSVGHAKLPLLLQKLAPEFCGEERQTPSFRLEENRIARTTANPRAPARKVNAKMGADGSPSQRISELPGFSGAEEFLAAACQVSEDRGAAGFDAVVGLPTFVTRNQSFDSWKG
jgi:hypothetical protein